MHSSRSVPSVLRAPLLPLALVLAAAVRPSAQEAAVPEPHPVLGAPLVIDGTVVPFDEIKRQIVFGPLGVETLRLARLKLFINEEIERQKAAGVDPAKFEVAQSDIDRAIADAEKQVDEVYKGQEINLEQLYPTKDETWLDNVKLTQQFNKVFLPDNPHEFPQVTIDALQSATQQPGAPPPPPPSDSPEGTPAEEPVTLYSHIVKDYDMRQADPSLAPDPVGKAMLAMITNQTVIKYLEASSDTIDDRSKLPAGVAMRVNGKDLKIEDLWRNIEKLLTPRDVESAKRWIVNTTLLEKSLRSTGHWLDDAAFQKAYEDYTAPYKDSPFSIENVALRFQKFPTVEAYKLYFRICESMRGRIRYDMREAILRKDGDALKAEARAKAERLVAEGSTKSVDELEKELFEEVLQDNVDKRWDEQLVRTSATRTSRLAGDARIQADIILVSAYDFAHKRWKENGWEQAEARTKQLMNELAGDLAWKDAVEKYSDFYDVPVPTEQASQFTLNNKGRFRSLARNELMKRLDESVYSCFVAGESLTDYIFFELPVNQIQEPIKGPYGYYLTKLYSRGGPKRMLDLENPDHRELIEQDFVAQRVEQLVRTLIEESEVYGI